MRYALATQRDVTQAGKLLAEARMLTPSYLVLAGPGPQCEGGKSQTIVGIRPVRREH